MGSDTKQLENNMQVFVDWLHTIRADGEPRMFKMQLDGYDESINRNKQFVNILKKASLEMFFFRNM